MLLVLTLVVSVIIKLVPSLEQYSSELVNVLWVLASVFIFGQSLEDAAKNTKVTLTDKPEINLLAIEVVKQALIDLGFTEKDSEVISESVKKDNE